MEATTDIEKGLLPEVHELGQEPTKNYTPCFGALYILLIFALMALIIYLIVRFSAAF